jgi:hypothetical protein
MDFTIDVTSQGGFSAQGMFTLTVGQMPILIIDLDLNQNSGPHLNAAIQDLGIGVDYTTSWPDDPQTYSNIFLCLGVYAYNHRLSVTEGDDLAAFLNAGGNLYMEGGDTWFWDDPTAVHSMFRINGIQDGDSDLDVQSGLSGTFTEGMSFNYAGDNSYIDRIEAIDPAYNLFENNFPAYFSAVANLGDGYRTIGSTFEFGGLANGSGISTRLKLMEEYLKFFEVKKVSEAPGVPVGEEEVCGEEQVPYSTTSVEGADMYYWTIVPEEAGTIDGMDTTVNILWSPSFTGMAYIKVRGMNNLGVGPPSDSTVVNVMGLPEQAAAPEGPSLVHTENTPSSLYTTSGATNASSYSWELSPENAGSLAENGTECTITWSEDYNGPVNVVLKVMGSNDCGDGEFSDEFVVEIENLGLDELAEDLGVSIYPNPNQGTFTLELNTNKVDKVSIRVMNSTGHLVYEEMNAHVNNAYSKLLDISTEAEGIYLIIIQSDLGTYTSKIILKR